VPLPSLSRLEMMLSSICELSGHCLRRSSASELMVVELKEDIARVSVCEERRKDEIDGDGNKRGRCMMEERKG
jgi:hypothetical protein